jgi:hypothetical protein
MPRNEIDYSKTIIYKIVCNDLSVTDCYVGSTTDFKTRKAMHKSDCNNEKGPKYDYKVYKMIRENKGWENWTMLQIELYPCNNSNDAHARERYWYENMNAKLNTKIPNRSKKEYQDEYKDQYKDHIKEYSSKYKDDHKEHLKEYKAKYYEENKDHIKEKILIDGRQEIQCPSCNCIIKKYSLNKHNKTVKHIKNSKPNDEIIETL